MIEAAGSASSNPAWRRIAQAGGPIVILGVVSGPLEVPFGLLLTKEIRLIASLGQCGHPGQREQQLAASMLAARPEIAESLITHRFPLEDAAEAFRVAADRRSGAIKVVMQVA